MPRKSTRRRIARTCRYCGVTFLAEPKAINKGGALYCCKACAYKGLRTSPLVRFWSKVAIAGPDDCWLWKGATDGGGYGTFAIDTCRPTRLERAHRFSYALAHSGIPDGAWILHTCDTPACVNPSHLYAGTPTDNVRDMLVHDRYAKTHNTNQAGERNPQARLSEDDVRTIRRRRETGETYASIACDYGISTPHAYNLCAHKRWRHI